MAPAISGIIDSAEIGPPRDALFAAFAWINAAVAASGAK